MEMANWKGAAGVCVNERNEILLVLMKAPEEDSKWSVPASGMEAGETLEQCCEREFEEVTGLTVKAGEILKTRDGNYEDAAVSFDLHYFRVEVTGGELIIPKDDFLIEDIAWKSITDIEKLELAYPDDLELFKSLIAA
ncbi:MULTISPECIES: NUDIX hydrolase [unclassified Planococcus (in: firmicutes)]|uniref:NUDIX hydrolase n=1 Tax=Planococcus TaxID=1372 RepID=UPI000C348378|nr:MULTISPECIES: NUDIX domain-containing protein [unclassified Planococcus (in: firmicutes)]AUD12843.1 DNA mismatch repair protein MutT [Planococcus sp. MB-3u-03]PKG47461.1 DNA mismatch repair protein MutT [Planococcus sp. Urea-trap-24]PKG88215.1 DNA mismatch repair protein MutT [Planococcus sp. Urea-3u-39]PKH36860.1 DNA mismatch repair protein MutT [Planococcus sp. MB-3u-09]